MSINEIFNTPSNGGGGAVGAYSCFTNTYLLLIELPFIYVVATFGLFVAPGQSIQLANSDGSP